MPFEIDSSSEWILEVQHPTLRILSLALIWCHRSIESRQRASDHLLIDGTLLRRLFRKLCDVTACNDVQQTCDREGRAQRDLKLSGLGYRSLRPVPYFNPPLQIVTFCDMCHAETRVL
jgi:hypothetical protein